MPFTLAHPAAVLPFRRFCPRRLSFAALVIGSVVPDVSYVFEKSGLEGFAHSFKGGFGFCLPVGVLMLVAFYLMRRPAVERLPEKLRRIFTPMAQQPIPSPIILLVSLMLGIWTHLVWDSFTHPMGWLVLRMDFFQYPLLIAHHHYIRVCNILSYACSFLGVTILCYAYEQWLVSSGAIKSRSRFTSMCFAILIGLGVLPIEAVHHLMPNIAGYAMVGVFTLALVAIAVWKIGDR